MDVNDKLDKILENQNIIIEHQKKPRPISIYNIIIFIIILLLAYIVFDGWNKLVLQLFNKYYPTNIKLLPKILFLIIATFLLIFLFMISGINIRALEVAI